MQSTKIAIQLHYTTIRLTINKNLFKKNGPKKGTVIIKCSKHFIIREGSSQLKAFPQI